MPQPLPNILLIVDDREFAADEVRAQVGLRRFGDIVVRRQSLIAHLRGSLPAWAAAQLVHLRSADELPALRARLEASGDNSAAFVIAARAGIMQADRLLQLVERLPFAEEDFTDRLYKPLLVFLRNAHSLVEQWAAFEAAPLHLWEQAWQGCQRVQSLQPLDLAKIRDFLSYTVGSTAARHFNRIEAGDYYYTKSSTLRAKIEAEYKFYGLAPEAMRPWLIQPFDYQDDGQRASYKMLRHYLADAALQWVHGAFDADSFGAFVDRLLFFLAERPRKACSREQSAQAARALFVTKLETRAQQFLALDEGRRIDTLAASAGAHLALAPQLERFKRLYARHEAAFAFDHMVVGHGDPCFSNVLYDQQRHLLQLIDPKGALNADDIWTHPLYDLCKVSHSALGDYDFINNGMCSVGFTDGNDLVLRFAHTNHGALKPLFTQRLRSAGHAPQLVRLGEASLFLSMLPLHVDCPNKALAFMLKANQILDEVEHG
jgi:hypothetical protein